MIKEPTTEAELPDFLAMKLAEFAISQRGHIPDHGMATAFIAIGMQLAVYAHGEVAAAEWLRDVADQVENLTALEKGKAH